MLKTNKKQSRYYNQKKRNIITELWSKIRERNFREFRKESNVENDMIDIHKLWIGDISKKRVLDMGCYAGNILSLSLAQNAKEYVGIDLSKEGIAKLNHKLKINNIINAKAFTLDFLSAEALRLGKFDLIYIYSAMHHFKYFETFLKRLDEFLMDGGKVVTIDPTETSLIIKIARILYRPFQQDKEWEWPFKRKSYKQIQKIFIIEKVQGFVGLSKFTFFLGFLPISKDRITKFAKYLHNKDLEKAKYIGRHLYRCMHVAMLLRKKKEI